MRFGVDAHAIGRRLTGNEVYIQNLLHQLAQISPPGSLIAYLSPEGMRAGAEVLPPAVERRLVSGNSFVRLGFALSRQLRRDRPALVHVQYTAPSHCPVPIVVTVHDISYLEEPRFLSSARALQLQVTVAHTVRRAARVLTPSEFSRQKILQVYHLNEDKVVRVPNAQPAVYRPLSRQMTRRWVEARYRITAPFILHVGDLRRRKNQLRLVQAFEALIAGHPQLPHHLLLAGQRTHQAGEILSAVRRSRLRDRIHLLDFVPNVDLLYLYNACDIFVFPSLYEGFGIPVLEAMACGRAVACSSAAALPEVADSAALFFDPNSVDQMVRAMRDLLLDAELRARMERLGLQRAAQFSWRDTARKTLSVYEEVAGLERQPVGAPVVRF
jgi:glycosyltransferase involved in cell wall biosynthesis